MAIVPPPAPPVQPPGYDEGHARLSASEQAELLADARWQFSPERAEYLRERERPAWWLE